MPSNAILIRNIYVMLAYACRAIRHGSHERLATERFDHVHDLFAEILIQGVGTQIKRGLHRDYVDRTATLATVRGKIDVPRTVAARSVAPGKLVCEFYEYHADTPHNQALKCAMVLLIRHGDVSAQRRDELRRLLAYLDSVTLIAPSAIRWGALTYHRANASYRLLLGVCELIVRGLLITEETGEVKLASWVSDEAMSNLYERFIREYYAFHHPELSPRASTVAWDYDTSAAEAVGLEQLPTMRTDVTLRRGIRTLIIDAKYYARSLQVSEWGKESVHSANLYQLLTYVKNADVARDGSVSGLLLYARTEAPAQPDLDVRIQGNRIRAHTLDLNQPWGRIRDQLEDFVRMLLDSSHRWPRPSTRGLRS